MLDRRRSADGVSHALLVHRDALLRLMNDAAGGYWHGAARGTTVGLPIIRLAREDGQMNRSSGIALRLQTPMLGFLALRAQPFDRPPGPQSDGNCHVVRLRGSLLVVELQSFCGTFFCEGTALRVCCRAHSLAGVAVR
jgi:hypothetical protein